MPKLHVHHQRRNSRMSNTLRLEEKYQPRRLTDIVGQEEAVDALRRHIAEGKNASLLFVGPPGTGKTSIARIYGAVLQCPVGGTEPCGECDSCTRIFAQYATFGWCELNAGRFNEKEHSKTLATLLDGGLSAKYGGFVDEIHALDNAAADALLKSVESPGSQAYFIGATTELAAVRPALRSRCSIIRFKPISPPHVFGLMKRVAETEGIRYEPKAFDIIASASNGSAREALIMLDQVSGRGDVSTKLAAQTLDLGHSANILIYIDALLKGDPNEIQLAIDEWQALPSEKAKLIKDFFLFVFNHEVSVPASNHIVNAAFYQIANADRQRVAEQIKARWSVAVKGALSFQEYWLELMEAWCFADANVADHTDLMVKTHKVGLLLGPKVESYEPDCHSGTEEVEVKSVRRRTALRSKGPNDAGYLDQKQAKMIYSAASFLPQHYGQWFNTKITIDHEALGLNEMKASKLLSDFTHQLSLHVKRRGQGGSAHWFYVNSLDEAGPVSEVVLHLPICCVDELGEWAKAWFSKRSFAEGQKNNLPALELPKRTARLSLLAQVKRHWRLVRSLWSGVNPNIQDWDEQDRRKPLPSLLGVYQSQFRNLGQLVQMKRLGSSGSLGPSQQGQAAMESMNFLSCFADRAWSELDKGWEINEFKDRKMELEKRKQDEERIKIEWEGMEGKAAEIQRDRALEELRANWPADPHKRLRSWDGWWS